MIYQKPENRERDARGDITDYPDHFKPAAGNLKTKSPGRTTLFLPRWWSLPCSAWPERLLSESQDAVALQQIKERGALPMIDRGDIRQAIDRCSNIWGFTAGRWLWSVRA